jgi:hypothetical protein
VREKDKSGYINDNKNCVTFRKLNVNGESFLGSGKTYVISLRYQQEQKDSKAKVSCKSESLKLSLSGSLCVSADTSWGIRKRWGGSITEAVLQVELFYSTP